jgi:hypothetical protein
VEQVHELVPGPVLAHVAFGSQLPLLIVHESMAEHVVPFPEYPVWHVQVLVAGPVGAQAAFLSQPPLFTRQLLIEVQVLPSPW